MQNQSSTRRIKQLLAIIIVLFVAWIGYMLYLQSTFRIVSTNPATSNVALASPYIVVNFSRTLSMNGISITSKPAIISSYKAAGKAITINLNTPLLAKTSYTITITSVADTQGAKITNKTISFTPKDIAFGDLPSNQQQQILKNQTPTSGPQTDPILAHLPYSTLDYRLDPNISTGADGKEQLTIQAQLYYLPSSSMSQSDQLAQAKQEVLAYISSLGLDPANYNIQYQTITQTLNGSGT